MMNSDKIMNVNSSKQKLDLLLDSVQTKKEFDSLTFMWMEHLFESKCPSKLLINSSFYLEPKHLDEVLEERNLNDLCGYPICDKQPKKLIGKYHIQVDNRKVIETTNVNKFCSKFCHRAYDYFKLQLSTEAVYFRDIEKWQPVNLLKNEDIEKSSQIKQAN